MTRPVCDQPERHSRQRAQGSAYLRHEHNGHHSASSTRSVRPARWEWT
jgi:hypothetical protein